jgi:hypothetical protein
MEDKMAKKEKLELILKEISTVETQLLIWSHVITAHTSDLGMKPKLQALESLLAELKADLMEEIEKG